MNKIATIRYSESPLNGEAHLFLHSPPLSELYKKLGFPVRDYTRDNYEIYENFSAFLVRGISIDGTHEFSRGENQFRIFTQRCGNCSLVSKDDSGRATVNISHIRGVDIGKGFSYKVKTLNPTKARHIMMIYSEGVIEYYNCLKNHLSLQTKWSKNLEKKS